MSSLLISGIGNARGRKRRKVEGGQAEEEKKEHEDEEEDEMISDFIDDTSNISQFGRSKTQILLPGSSGKVIGTRANHKKRNHGQFQHDQAAAKAEQRSTQSRDFKTPQTQRNSM